MTRRSEDLHVGVSTRGALTLYRAAQSMALVSGRDFVVPDDIKRLAVPVLAHRVLGKSFLQAGEFGAAEAIIRDIVDRVRCANLTAGRPILQSGGGSPTPRRIGEIPLMSVQERIRTQSLAASSGVSARGTGPCAGPDRADDPDLGRPVVLRLAMVVLLTAGVMQQINLILLVATLAAGPFVASLFSSRAHAQAADRASVGFANYVFSGDPLVIEYQLENGRRWTAALALFIEDALSSVDRTVTGRRSSPSVFFARVAARDRVRIRWQGASPRAGQVSASTTSTWRTRAPFGIVERRVTVPAAESAPRLSQDRPVDPSMVPASAADERESAGPAARSIGPAGRIPRTSRLPLRRQPALDSLADLGPPRRVDGQGVRAAERARTGDPDRPLASPHQGLAARQREAVEQAISLRGDDLPGRLPPAGPSAGPGLDRGHAGRDPGAGIGQARARAARATGGAPPTNEGGLAELFDALPQATLRDALLIVVSTRPLNLVEEAERSTQLTGASARNLLGRAIVLNASQGDLDRSDPVSPSRTRGTCWNSGPPGAEQERRTSHEDRRQGVLSGEAVPDDTPTPPPGNGEARP